MKTETTTPLLPQLQRLLKAAVAAARAAKFDAPLGSIGGEEPTGRGVRVALRSGPRAAIFAELQGELAQAERARIDVAPSVVLSDAELLLKIAEQCLHDARASRVAHARRRHAVAALWRAADAWALLRALAEREEQALAEALAGRRLVFTTVPTGNGEPEVFADQFGRAHWADRSRVLLSECSETAENIAAARARHHLDEGDVIDLELVGSIVRGAKLTVKGPDGLEVIP